MDQKCINNINKGALKVAKAISKIKTDDCSGAPSVLPGLDIDPNSIGDTMVQKDLDLIHALFGSDLDSGVIVSRSDDKLGSKCQRGIIKEAGKCQSAKLRSYNECKKGGMKDRDEPITSPAEFETLCMTPTILDVKGRIDKACTKGLPKRLTSSCSLPNVDALIPGCAPGVSAACIDQKVECVVCLALNALDGLARDCDDFDDGVVNGSCP